ncbi:unnamed protein product [Cylicocyclus nassatus]|uniref:GOLD domain-containing protein n=1 Tax=Cylicocyclus nassatus TaxID=53992 RepID=A0AA36GPS5_CYLNA|nr:unnamed protein product [Cylicocyclus nassatus]
MELDSRLTCMYETLEKNMLLKLNLSPAFQSRFPMSLRLTSPSGEFSEWAEGEGEAYMKHNTTEDGDYEICLNAPRPVKVNLNIFFHNPERMEKSLDRYLKVHEMKDNVKYGIARCNMLSTSIVTILLLLSGAASEENEVEMYVDRSITMDFDSKMTCFYEALKANVTLYLNLMPQNVLDHNISLRLTSPSGDLLEWSHGMEEVNMEYNLTENGDYEICVVLKKPLRATLSIYAEVPVNWLVSLTKIGQLAQVATEVLETATKLLSTLFKVAISLKHSNTITSRDEAMQNSNSFYIKMYVCVFCITAIIVAIVQVNIVQRMFYVDYQRLRV